MHRRQFLTGVAAGLAAGLAPRRADAEVSVAALTGRVSLVTGAGTNVVALSAPGGLVVVDTGAPASADALVASLGRMGRVTTAFNTHYHLDHTGANAALRQSGARIIAHVNTKLWMATPVWVPADDRYRPPRPPAAIPDETFYAGGSIAAGGDRIDYGYLAEAHTNGDIYVFFRDANVIAVGDVCSPAVDPEFDYLTGAWLGGRVDALTRLVKLCDAGTKIVPGRGPVMDRASLQAELDLMKTIYTRAVDRVREGDDADDMLKHGVLDGVPRTWADPRKFLYDVSKGLWAHHNKLNPNVV
jgi:cyclase